MSGTFTVFLAHLEMKRLTWHEDANIQNLHASYVLNVPHSTTPQRNGKDTLEICYMCNMYQDHKCVHDRGHKTAHGFQHHTCTHTVSKPWVIHTPTLKWTVTARALKWIQITRKWRFEFEDLQETLITDISVSLTDSLDSTKKNSLQSFIHAKCPTLPESNMDNLNSTKNSLQSFPGAKCPTLPEANTACSLSPNVHTHHRAVHVKTLDNATSINNLHMLSC